MVADTWLAAASKRLTGDIPELVACVLVAATKLLRVASARSRSDRRVSRSTSDRSRCARRSNDRRSSIMDVTELMTDFIGVSTRVGALDRPAVRRPSMADTKAVIWMSRIPPSGDTGSWSSTLSNLGVWRKS